MCKVAISLGFAAVCASVWRFLFAPPFLAKQPDGATSLLLTAALFTIAIAAAVRK
jgi:hypothetical protein